MFGEFQSIAVIFEAPIPLPFAGGSLFGLVPESFGQDLCGLFPLSLSCDQSFQLIFYILCSRPESVIPPRSPGFF